MWIYRKPEILTIRKYGFAEIRDFYVSMVHELKEKGF